MSRIYICEALFELTICRIQSILAGHQRSRRDLRRNIPAKDENGRFKDLDSDKQEF